VEVEPKTEPRLVNVEEVAEPGQEKAIIRGSLLANPTAPSRFVPSPAYSAAPATRNSRSVSRPMRSRPSARSRSISASFSSACRCGRRFRAPWLRFSRTRLAQTSSLTGTSRTERDRPSADAELGADLGVGPAGGPQLTGAVSFGELASVPHRDKYPPGV
jgi:hypothetical protein